MDTSNRITVTFRHPMHSGTIRADVGLKLTAAEAVAGLIEAGFVEKLTPGLYYCLESKSSGPFLRLNDTFESASVKNGATLCICICGCTGL
jgi:hypothetical protein